MNKLTVLSILWLGLIATPLFAQNSKQAGLVEFSRGITTAQKEGQSPRIVGDNGVFYENEVLTTSAKSFAVIRLKDESRMTLRPNTQFSVEQIDANKARNDNAVLRLFKGGLRAVTGFISKNISGKSKHSNYQLKTPVATIGIRGTEFDARLCEQDCVQKESEPEIASTGGAAPVARVAFIKGTVVARGSKGQTRKLQAGSSLYEGDTVSSVAASHAVLAFVDNSRVTVQANSLFRVENFRYNHLQPDKSSALLNLIKGGLRAFTGLIGKAKPQSYKVKTPVATIGIRGTGFDLQCQGKCVDRFYQSQSSIDAANIIERLANLFVNPAVAATPSGSGLFAYVWSGQIELQVENQTVLLDNNTAAFLPNGKVQPIILPEVPAFMKNNPLQRPDKVEIKKELLQSKPQTTAKPGLYVSVDQGQVVVNGVELNPGQAAFSGAGGEQAQRLTAVPSFITEDAFPKPSQFNRSMFRLLRVIDDSEREFECDVQ